MPPLSLTQSKYALAALVMSVKSVPGCLVTIAPILIGVPLAFWPLPRPHLELDAVVLVAAPPAGVAVLLALSPLSSPPHPPRTSTRATAAAQSAALAGRSRSVKGLTCIALLLLVVLRVDLRPRGDLRSANAS